MKYLETGIEILKKLNQNDYEAFFVGGVVRDILLLEKDIKDIDITTSALPGEVISLFDKTINIGEKYGTILVVEGPYKFEITTYREEFEYIKNRKPEVKFVKNKITDINRRDLTINSILMDQSLTVVDPLDFMKDITDKKLRVVGEIDKKLTEDPLRILRIIRFIGKYRDFEISNEIIDYFDKTNLSRKIEKISSERIKDEFYKILELDKILRDKSFRFISKYLVEIPFFNNIDACIGSNISKEAIIAILQDNINENYFKLSKKELKLFKLVNKNKNKQLSLIEIFDLDYKVVELIDEINTNIYNIDENISKTKDGLILNEISDLEIKSIDIINIVGDENRKEIGKIYTDIIKEVLNKELKNDLMEITNYIKKNYIK